MVMVTLTGHGKEYTWEEGLVAIVLVTVVVVVVVVVSATVETTLTEFGTAARVVEPKLKVKLPVLTCCSNVLDAC